MNAPIEGQPPEGKHSGEHHPATRRLGDLQKAITMAQIAKAAGVSQGAISSLLNDRDYGIRVSEKTRERVFKVCREMGYIPNDLRAVVRMYPELGDFCILISQRFSAGMADPWVSGVVETAMEATTSASFSLSVGRYEEGTDYTTETTALPPALQTGVASKYILLGGSNPSLLQALARRGFPAVALGQDFATSNVLSLVPDYQQASQIALAALFDAGHRDIAIVSGPFGETEPETIELHRGIRLGSEDAGISLDPKNIIYSDKSFEAGVSALETLMQSPTPPTAVFCITNTLAAGVLAGAQARGLKVPGDLSIVGFGTRPGGAFTAPALTTVEFPVGPMTRRAVAAMEELLREGASGAARKEVFSVIWVPGGTCGRVHHT
jgi:DNA-binding LacI/PurR family transcriptional regulator